MDPVHARQAVLSGTAALSIRQGQDEALRPSKPRATPPGPTRGPGKPAHAGRLHSLTPKTCLPSPVCLLRSFEALPPSFLAALLASFLAPPLSQSSLSISPD